MSPIIALTRLNSQRPRRRDTTRCSKTGASVPCRNNSRLARLTTPNNAMANKANSRDHAVIYLLRACAQPSHHFTLRQPASHPGQRTYSATACSAA